MKTCPDCTNVKEQVKNNPNFTLVDIGEHVRNLKQFLKLRDNNPAFDNVKRNGSIGIPCFVQDDGMVSFSLKNVDFPRPTNEGSSCNIDGKGC